MRHAPDNRLNKLPAVTLGFWIIKIIATTLGETGGDAVTMTLGFGYLLGSAIFAAVLAAAIAAQVASRRFHPFLYWAVIVATTTAGTALADFADRSLGIGYAGGSALLFAALLTVLALWYWSVGSVSVNAVTTRRAELFYWATILFSQTLGTALGDLLAVSLGLGYGRGALVFSAGLAVVAGLAFGTRLSRTALFWAAFILTRPLGATLGDLLDKPIAQGGFAVGRFEASAVLAIAIVLGILLIPQRPGGHPNPAARP